MKQECHKINATTNLFLRQEEGSAPQFIISERTEGESISLDKDSALKLFIGLANFFVKLDVKANNDGNKD